ncbi:MAG: c-type cytochrome [Myxococcales bacterium]|nr:c-type cytochrome [Myxococcales bacterium]
MEPQAKRLFAHLAVVAAGLAAMVLSIFYGLPMCNPDYQHRPGVASSGAGGARGAPARAPDTVMRSVGVNSERIAVGQALFNERCIACHGKEGSGKIGIGPRLNSKTFLAAASDAFLIRTITKGRAGTTMVPWGAQLDAGKIKAIVGYIRSWQQVAPAKLDERPVAGNAAAGRDTFRGICAACHGRTGAGYMETANGTGIGRKAFLSAVTNGYLRYLVNHGKSGTKMKPFAKGSKVAVANLGKQEIENVIAYLRQSAW